MNSVSTFASLDLMRTTAENLVLVFRMRRGNFGHGPLLSMKDRSPIQRREAVCCDDPILPTDDHCLVCHWQCGPPPRYRRAQETEGLRTQARTTPTKERRWRCPVKRT